MFRVISGGTETVRYSFTGGETDFGSYNDGAVPQAGLLKGADSNLYGTTSRGGPYQQGTVFSLADVITAE